MSTTLIDVKNTFEQELNLSPDAAERVAKTVNDYLKSQDGLATKSDVSESERRIIYWVVGLNITTLLFVLGQYLA
jgi:hypothetical protein